MSTTSSGAVITRPYDERNRAIQFTNSEGTRGEYTYPINHTELRNLKGRLLTVIDATNGDPQQRKALKDLVWQTLQLWMRDIQADAGREPSPMTLDSDESIRLATATR